MSKFFEYWPLAALVGALVGFAIGVVIDAALVILAHEYSGSGECKHDL